MALKKGLEYGIGARSNLSFLNMRIEKSQIDEESHRRQTGRADHAIVFRPDHFIL